MRPRLIILEGPDGGGKSTLGQELFKLTGAKSLFHHGPYLDQAKTAPIYLESLVPYLTGEDPEYRDATLILDRSWLSEPIYASIYREAAPRVKRVEQRTLERAAHALGGVVINCLPARATALANWQRRRNQGCEYVTRSDLMERIHHAYSSLECATSLPVVYYDYQSLETPADLWCRLQRLLDSTNVKPNGGPGSGQWRPTKSVLIVGDRGSQPDEQGALKTRLPFSDLTGGGCSLWLNAHLEQHGISERHLYWINAFDEHGKPVSGKFIDELQPRAAILLGEAALGWWNNLKLASPVDFYAIQHPQFHKRFRANEQYSLGNLLRTLTKRD